MTASWKGSGGADAFVGEGLPQPRIAFDQADQRHAQHPAADDLARAHRKGVGQDEGRGGRRVGEKDRDLGADDDGVPEDRGQGRRDGQAAHPGVPHRVGAQAGQEGGQGAKDHVDHGGAQQVGQGAAQGDAQDVLGPEEGQQAQGLGHAHLDGPVREGGQPQAQGHIEGCHHGAAGQFADGKGFLVHRYNTPSGKILTFRGRQPPEVWPGGDRRGA